MAAAAVAALSTLVACQSGPEPIQPPDFDYATLSDRFFRRNPGGQFPLTVQRGANLHPDVAGEYLFYTSSRDGSGDIWMRSLRTAVSIPLIRHPAEQYKPAIAPEGRRLAFVSEDADSSGDIRLIAIEPDDYAENAVNGLPAPELWPQSVNLSEDIAEQSAGLEESCRGTAAETDPVWSPDGGSLVYSSDRCSPGEYNIWILPMSGMRAAGAPRQLSREGGVRPRFSPDGRQIVFADSSVAGSRLLLMKLDDASQTTLQLPGGEAGDGPPLYFDAALAVDSAASDAPLTLYYAAVRKDSNGDGRLDRSDHAGVFSLPLEAALRGAGRERSLVDSNARLAGLNVSAFLGGSILYAAEAYNSVNVYFVKPGGVVPREKSIEAQFQLAQRYRRISPQRYPLALEAIGAYFPDVAERFLYDVRTRLLRAEFAEQRRELQLRDRILNQLRADAAADGFAALQLSLSEKPQPEAQQRALAEFSARIELQPGGYSAAQARLAAAAALLQLSEIQEKRGLTAEAARSLEQLTQKYPEYHLIEEAQFRLGRLQLVGESRIPEAFIALAQNSNESMIRERIVAAIYEYCTTVLTPGAAQQFTAGQTTPSTPPTIRSALLLAQAQANFEEKKFQAALTSAQSALAAVVMENNRPGPGWRTLFVRGWQIIAAVHEKNGAFSEAYAARITYGGAYSADALVDIDTDDFVELIEDGERSINLFVRTARSVAESVREQEAVSGGAGGLTAIGVGQRIITLNSADRDLLSDFCNPGSRNGALFLLLGPRFVQRYGLFCEAARPTLQIGGDGRLSTEAAREGVDLLYTGAYADGNIINLLFLNMSRLGVLPALYRERSVYYHRLKNDLAAEKSRFLMEAQERQFLFLSQSDVAGVFQSQDPYRTETFDEALGLYRTVQKEASEAGDLSMIFGYAYALIKKNVEKEAFYSRIQESAAASQRNITERFRPGGVYLPQDLLREKKEETLRDFKSAEYLLVYILNVDPLQADAYLLLGWLYQYLDEQQQRRVYTVPTLLEDIYYFISRTEPIAPLDRNFYSDLYRNYFPEALYEASIELYRQALEKQNEGEDPHAAGALNLNLANSYFRLLNFKRAIQHYNAAEMQFDRVRGEGFDEYRQRALFEANLGRALFYDGQPRLAAGRLQRAYRIYDELERKPLHERYSTLSFLLRTRGADAAGGESAEVLKYRIDQLQKKTEAVRYKMALLAALTGLAQWEAGEFDEANLSYRDAELRLYGDAGAGPQRIDRSSLMNFIALSLQSKGDYSASDERAEQAARYARDLSLVRIDEQYLPQTVGGRALGCLLPYGEDFSVVGEGRNPYGFSPLRQYELALGIQLENRILQGDLSGAEYLLRQRRQIFEERDFDLRLGRSGAIAALSQSAVNAYRAGDFDRAATLFRDAADSARRYGLLDSFRRNLANRFKSLFALFEEEDIDPRLMLNRIDEALEELSVFRSDYQDQVRLQFIQEQSQEDPEFQYDEDRDGPALRLRVNRQLSQILLLESGLHFFRGRKLQSLSMPEEQAQQEFFRALERYSDWTELETGEQANSPRSIRVRINRARTLAAAGRLLSARAELAALIEICFEFGLRTEEWHARALLAQILAELGETPGRERLRSTAVEEFRAGIQMLGDTPRLYDLVHRSADSWLEQAASYLIQQNDSTGALRAIEMRWELQMNWQFLRNPIEFRDAALLDRFNRLRRTHNELHALDREESRLRYTRQNLRDLNRRRTQIAEQSSRLRKEIVKLRPRWRVFVELPSSQAAPQPQLSPGQIVVRQFRSAVGVVAWCYRGRAAPVFVRPPPEARSDDVRPSIASCLDGQTVRSWTLIPDRNLYYAPYEAIAQEMQAPIPQFGVRLTDHFVPFLDGAASAPDEVFVHNTVSRAALDYEGASDQNADVLALDIPDSQILFRAGERLFFDARRWLADDRFAALALAMRTDDEPAPTYLELALLYEALRAQGLGTLAIAQPAKNERLTILGMFRENAGSQTAADREDSGSSTESSREQRAVRELLRARGQADYTASGLRIFGAAGYRAESEAEEMARLRRDALDRARSMEYSGELSKARDLYRYAQSLATASESRGDRFLDARAIARIGLRLARTAPEREAIADSLIASAGQDQSLRNSAVDDIIETLLESGDLSLARRYAAQSETNEGRADLATLEFLARLRRNRYSENAAERDAFFQSLQRVALRLSAGPRAREAGLLLASHGLNAPAIQVAAALRQRGQTGAAAAVNFEAEATRHLLFAGETPETYPGADASPSAQLLFAAIKATDADFTAQLESIPTQPGGLALAKFRRRLFEQYRAWRRFHPPSLLDLADVTTADGSSAYRTIAPIERLILFRLLQAAMPYDAELQALQSMESLLRAERGASENRAAWMALTAAETQLDLEDFPGAIRLLQLHFEASASALPDRGRELRAARLGIALAPVGLRAPLNTRVGAWSDLLVRNNYSHITKILQSVPGDDSSESIQRWNQAILEQRTAPAEDGPLSIFSQLRVAAALTKLQAVGGSKWRFLANAAMHQEALQTWMLARERGDTQPPPVYEDTAGALLAGLPAGQSVALLADTANRAYRLLLVRGEIQAAELEGSGRYLRGRAREFLSQREGRLSFASNAADLARRMRALSPVSQSGVLYVWMPDVLALAPMPVDRGDRIFQILDPRQLSRSRVVWRPGAEFSPEFEIAVRQSGARRNIAREADSAYFLDRLEQMERLSLGPRNDRQSGLHRHWLLTTESGRDLAPVVDSWAGESRAPWLLSVFQENRGAALALRSYRSAFDGLSRSAAAPGIVNLRSPDSFGHPYFLRLFYSRSLREPDLARRFSTSVYALRRVTRADEVDAIIYRLFTPVWIQSPTGGPATQANGQ